MTIFLDIVKPYLKEKIKRIRDHSVAADRCMTNTLLSWVSLGRDEELSKAKRDLADQLLVKLESAQDKESDEKTFEHLMELLNDCKGAAAKKSKEKKYNDEGHFGPAMGNVIQQLEKVYRKFNESNLLDFPNDDEPLNLFRYFAALYYAQKIDDGYKISGLGKIAQNPKLTSFSELSEQKEQLIMKTLEECERDLGTLDSQHEDYPTTKKSRVWDWLDKLERANKELCEKHGSTLSLPITFALFSTINIQLPTLHPESGFLEECIIKAKKAIDPEHKSLELTV
ncbi:coiled-coil protein [Legionella lansingensis]|uniref:Coiled-coil protein n=1 Tax=Legionella lansingensis TaxID=45067 RepID=A0A0W0VM65_9GAMM|nr:hypothetical protein [Legionella lansingensis]KTD20886.1 coiled-coil protein [Legionella lansingensis]SNV43759.1 coiled-coil protein [Legionella lansingensis]